MITTVLMDLDDTIFDFKACERQAISTNLNEFDVEYSAEDLSDYSVINDRMWKKLERGEITRDQLRTERFRVFLSRYDRQIDSSVFADRYMENLSKTSELIDGARELLIYLSAHYALYAVTNGYVRTQVGRIRHADIEKYFDEIFISQRIGADKPRKEFFDYCASHIPNFCLKNTVLIGDSLTSDIKGGKEYGLFTIRYDPKGDVSEDGICPDRVVRSLSEIPSLLSEI